MGENRSRAAKSGKSDLEFVTAAGVTGVLATGAAATVTDPVGNGTADSVVNDSITEMKSVVTDVPKENAPVDDVKPKTLHNSAIIQARGNVPDIKVFGDGDMFKLLCKASSKSEGWMKSTKAMQIDGVGCVIQVTTQNRDNVAEALLFVPRVKIFENKDEEGKVVGRKLVGM